MALSRWLPLLLAAALLGPDWSFAQEAKPAAPQTTPAAPQADDEQAAVAKVAAAYVQAFNQQDVDALTGHWTEAGSYTNETSDETVKGRDAIGKAFAKTFQERGPAPRMAIETKSIQIVSPSVAMERGLAIVTRGTIPAESRYVAVYVKVEGQWRLDRVVENDLSPEESRHDHLQGLEWMIGQWVDQGDGFTISMDCRWTANRSYIARRYSVEPDDGELSSAGLQIIGWDAKARQVRSWLFDSEGGFVAGEWREGDGEWTVQSVVTLADGASGSFTSVFRPQQDGSYTWQKIHRVRDGRVLPNLNEVTVVRKEQAVEETVWEAPAP